MTNSVRFIPPANNCSRLWHKQLETGTAVSVTAVLNCHKKHVISQIDSMTKISRQNIGVNVIVIFDNTRVHVVEKLCEKQFFKSRKALKSFFYFLQNRARAR